ncbi:MAG: hypothetical protein RLZZ231_1331 [Bacteroidota bacterium]|jgi:hypothetical protein
MQKSALSFIAALLLVACAENKSDKNLQITGYIKGFTKGKLYIQKIKDSSLVALDTIDVNGDSHFTSDIDIQSPEMLYLFIDRGVSNSVDNNLLFFAEPGKINIETSLRYFTSDAKITGSKNHELYEEYKYVTSKYVDKDLDLLGKKFKAYKDKNEVLVNTINKKQEDILKSKYLYATNFAVNHSDYEIAPYIALSEIYDINMKYLDTIDKSMTPSVSKSLYGQKLKTLIKERKASEK